MKKLLLVFFILLSLPVHAKELNIIQVSEANYASDLDGGSVNGINQSKINLLKTIKIINKDEKLDYVIFSGDNVAKSRKENIKEFTQLATEIKKPYYFVIGNKDAHRVSGIEKKIVASYFNKVNRYQKKDDSNYTFTPKLGFTCIVLDGAVPVVPSEHGYFNEATLDWLDKTLKKNKRKKVLIFQHFPVVEPYEDYEKSTLNRDKYLDIINKYANIVLISSGHYEKTTSKIDEKGITHIFSPSLSKNKEILKIKIKYPTKNNTKQVKIETEDIRVE